MPISPAKENMLKKIRQALSNPVPLPFPHSEGTQSVFPASQEDNAVIFGEEFSKLQGKFVYCMDEESLLQQLGSLIKSKNWQKVYCIDERFEKVLNHIQVRSFNDLKNCDVSVTGCEMLVARTGSLVLSSLQTKGRTASVYAPIHVCIAFTSQLVFDVKDALVALKEKYNNEFPSFVTFASGPSRTADIEKTLVTGVHGPKEVYCFLVEG